MDTDTRHTRSSASIEAAMDESLKGTHAFSTGACPGCAECGLEDLKEADDDIDRYEIALEPHFSWHPCELCGSTLGGDRHPWHAIDDETGDLVHGTCCTDCLLVNAGYTRDEGETEFIET